MSEFAAFRASFEARDADRWLAFYAPDAERLEYRHANPPRAPNVMRGNEAIGAFIDGIAGAVSLRLSIDNEVVGEHRAAFTLT